MARIVLGPTVASASGSVGGCVFSRNRFGPYIRQRVLPVNPNTAAQVSVRGIFSSLAIAWNVDLDIGERAAWDFYALNTFGINGMTGFNAFIALNTPRILSGNARIDVAPGTFNLTELGTLIVIPTAATEAMSLTFDNTNEWAGAVGGFLHLSYARPVNESINFFKGPFQYAESIAGAVIPPTSPYAGVSVFPFVVGQRTFMRAIAQAADGRLSVPKIISAIAI